MSEQLQNAKAVKWAEFLQARNMNFFGIEEIKEGPHASIHPVLFRVFLETAGKKFPSMLVLDDTMFTMFQVLVAEKAVTAENKAVVDDLLNERNRKYKAFKYYTDEVGNICLDSCMPSTEASFDPEIVHAVIDLVLNHLKEDYPVLMTKVWGK